MCEYLNNASPKLFKAGADVVILKGVKVMLDYRCGLVTIVPAFIWCKLAVIAEVLHLTLALNVVLKSFPFSLNTLLWNTETGQFH